MSIYLNNFSELGLKAGDFVKLRDGRIMIVTFERECIRSSLILYTKVPEEVKLYLRNYNEDLTSKTNKYEDIIAVLTHNIFRTDENIELMNYNFGINKFKPIIKWDYYLLSCEKDDIYTEMSKDVIKNGSIVKLASGDIYMVISTHFSHKKLLYTSKEYEDGTEEYFELLDEYDDNLMWKDRNHPELDIVSVANCNKPLILPYIFNDEETISKIKWDWVRETNVPIKKV